MSIYDKFYRKTAKFMCNLIFVWLFLRFWFKFAPKPYKSQKRGNPQKPRRKASEFKGLPHIICAYNACKLSLGSFNHVIPIILAVNVSTILTRKRFVKLLKITVAENTVAGGKEVGCIIGVVGKTVG